MQHIVQQSGQRSTESPPENWGETRELGRDQRTGARLENWGE